MLDAAAKHQKLTKRDQGSSSLKEDFLALTFASQLDTLFGRLFSCP